MTGLTVAKVLSLIYILLLASAAVQDVLKLRISNLFSVLVALVCAAALAIDPGQDWWQHLLSFAIMLGLGILLFSAGWMGGGDSKLMAAAALAFDLGGLLRYLSLVLMIGGVIAIVTIVVRIFVTGRAGSARKTAIPYGVAIAIGAIVAKVMFPGMTLFRA